MLIVQEIPSFLAPAKFQMPVDGGETKEVQFSVRFLALPTTEVDDIISCLRPAQPLLPASATEGVVTKFEVATKNPINDQQIVDKVLCGFGEDVKWPDGSQIEFTPANVKTVLEIYGVRQAIVRSWFKHYVEAAAKN